MQNHPDSGGSPRIYLDHNATTPHSPLLRRRWSELIEYSGNPSSIHQDSRIPKSILRETRQKIGRLLNCSPLEIIFNSGASEGNNTVLKSVLLNSPAERNELVISAVEHPSVHKTALFLESLGVKVHTIPVTDSGHLNLEILKQKLSTRTALLSVMYANNETGTIFPIREISAMAHAVGALMHSDCVQMLGKTEINFNELNLDYATFSAHKFYALKGTGFCYVRKSSPWVPLIHGGGQERSRRGGTENVLGIAALNIVLDEVVEKAGEKVRRMQELRDYMETQILERIQQVSVTAAGAPRLPNTSSMVIDGVDGETLLMSLDLKGFSVSTGAACSSGNPEPSPVLLAMGLTRQQAQNSLRVSLGWHTEKDDIEKFVECLTEVVTKLRLIAEEEKQKSHVG